MLGAVSQAVPEGERIDFRTKDRVQFAMMVVEYIERRLTDSLETALVNSAIAIRTGTWLAALAAARLDLVDEGQRLLQLVVAALERRHLLR